LCQKALAVNQAPVRVSAIKLGRQYFVEAPHVAVLDRGDVVAIETVQSVEIS
jgi:hypothetical protein